MEAVLEARTKSKASGHVISPILLDESTGSENLPPLRHLMIRASAGSGKTYALTNRFIQLLLRGRQPEQILALTFTRKSAGEFFGAILRKLAGGAASEQGAVELSQALDLPGPEPAARYLELLQQMITQMPRLRLGTLDSFFASIVKAFPWELGLLGPIDMMDDAAVEEARMEAVIAMLEDDLADAALWENFLGIIKRAAFGEERVRFLTFLQEQVGRYQELQHTAPEAAQWGGTEAVFGSAQPWWKCEEAASSMPRAEFMASLAGQFPEKAEKNMPKWEEGMAFFDNYTFGQRMDGSAYWLKDRFGKAWPDILRGRATIKIYHQTYELDAAHCAHLRASAAPALQQEMLVRQARSLALHQLMRRFNQVYHQRVRSQGRLCFADLPRLLTGSELGTGGRAEVADEERDQLRLNIDYRLDGRFTDWLLDEFQDTSTQQWRVVANLADEILQTTGGERTLFVVGDSKQAIYRWRGGEERLFNQLLQQYNPGHGEAPEVGPCGDDNDIIVSQTLATSWRSCPAVLTMVNAVFSDRDGLGLTLPPVTMQRWNFASHQSAKKLLQVRGYAALWELEPDPLADAADAADDEETSAEEGAGDLSPKKERLFSMVAALLREMQPIRRGLSCGLLCRSNQGVSDLADYLRYHLPEIPVSGEADRHLLIDNQATLLLLSLIQYAAHPGDTMALEHLKMSPLRVQVEESGPLLPGELLRQINEEGYQEFVRHWSKELETAAAQSPSGPLDAFYRDRLEWLAKTAAEFDAAGTGDADQFLRRCRSRQVRESSLPESVQLMTIHKAKGLEFDAVILPDQDGGAMDEVRGNGLYVSRDGEGRVTWLLQAVPQPLARLDPTLRTHLEDESAAGAYEDLCQLYVALTRAKRGLYVITPKLPKDSEAKHAAALLKNILAGNPAQPVPLAAASAAPRAQVIWQTGEADWFEDAPVSAPPAEDLPETKAEEEASRADKPAPAKPLRRVKPSSEARAQSLSKGLLALENDVVFDFGKLVHRLLEKWDWSVGLTWESLAMQWMAAGLTGEPQFEQAQKQVRRCWEKPEIRSLLARPSPAADTLLWVEKPFELVDGREWISGTFDRVQLELDASGRAARATIFDFKTDQITGAARIKAQSEHHFKQMERYRQVLARITSLPEARIGTALIFTEVAQAAWCHPLP